MEHNIFYRNAVTLGGDDCQGIEFAGAGSGHVIRNNLFFGPGRIPISGNSAGHTTSDNLMDKAPVFVDANRSDFHLRKDSPANDSAKAHDAIATDSEGTPRPQGKARDLGAFEYHE